MKAYRAFHLKVQIQEVLTLGVTWFYLFIFLHGRFLRHLGFEQRYRLGDFLAASVTLLKAQQHTQLQYVPQVMRTKGRCVIVSLVFMQLDQYSRNTKLGVKRPEERATATR